MPPPPFALRRMTPDDVAGVRAVEATCYPTELHEEPARFLARIASFPRGCLVAVTPAGSVLGYVQAFPHAGKPPSVVCESQVPLVGGDDAAITAMLRDDPDGHIFLFDCACAPHARRLGIAAALLCAVIDTARTFGAREVRLVAVLGANAYWARHGFTACGDAIPPGGGYGSCVAMPMSLSLEA